MALPIIEQPIYGQMTLETAAWSTPFTWVDRTADIVGGVAYSEGGRVGYPGQSQVDVGTLNTTFKNLTTAPLVGDLVRLRRTGTTQYVFTGYVQDVSQQIVFDQSVSYSTPITLTSINCLDWVGYISQFQLEGIGGASPTDGSLVTSSIYEWEGRIAAIHKAIDSGFATKMIGYTYSAGTVSMGDTDRVGTISDHLDLITATDAVYWYGNHILPTNKTTGRTSLVWLRALSSAPSSGKTFTDEVGSAGQLHYTEIDLQSSSVNVANTIVANNRARINIGDRNVTRIGGFNDQNFMVINGTNTVGVAFDAVWKESDATSITTYGNRQAEIETNVGFQATTYNYISNPSAEYSATGYGGGASNVVRRRRPLDDASPFDAYDGEWAMRCRVTTAISSTPIQYQSGEDDGIPVTAGQTLYPTARAARGNPSTADNRARIEINWFNNDGGTISTSNGTQVALTNVNTWYKLSFTTGVVVPANAVRAEFRIAYSRSGGANVRVGDIMWADALCLSRFNVDYFDGDTQWDATNLYLWTGGVGDSPSIKVSNEVDLVAGNTLARYATTGIEITRIRWNAQEDITAVASIYVGSTIQVRYKGTTTTHRIVGIDGNVSPERYMIDYYLEKV